MLSRSKMTELGSQAPDFSLPNPINQKQTSLSDCRGEKATVVVFMCNHCPFVKHIAKRLSEVARIYSAQGVGFVGINANDVENYPDDSPEKMIEFAKKMEFVFPYLYDESQGTAKQYGAVCTPDFFVYDAQLKLRYRGRFDHSTPGIFARVTGKDLTTALEALIAGEPVPSNQKPSMGCNIKWK